MGVRFYVACVFLLALLVLFGWVGWLATGHAWAQYEANRGIHGTYRPASCRDEAFNTPVNATRRHPGGQAVSHQYTCRGTFTADGGGFQTQVSYTASVEPKVGEPLRAVVANRRSANTYVEGGSPAGYVMLALIFLGTPVAGFAYSLLAYRGKARRPAKDSATRRRRSGRAPGREPQPPGRRRRPRDADGATEHSSKTSRR
ncbi:hypothetical protein GCM10023322_78250 [Rugosimonospora acidiphila]|uniref:DUF3592 domain-containing protein n=1 Tax=Rugosimonospora acidiphila TaxID=556531 RepID=A0ABP9SPU4_9ACTN